MTGATLASGDCAIEGTDFARRLSPSGLSVVLALAIGLTTAGWLVDRHVSWHGPHGLPARTMESMAPPQTIVAAPGRPVLRLAAPAPGASGPYGVLLDPFFDGRPALLARAVPIDPNPTSNAAPRPAPLTAVMGTVPAGDPDGTVTALLVVADPAPPSGSTTTGRNVEAASPSPASAGVPASMASAEPDPSPDLPASSFGGGRVPLPAPRPVELRAAEPRPAGQQPDGREAPVRTPSRRDMAAAKPTDTSPTPPSDGRNVLEKLFGIGAPSAPSGQQLAYAKPESGFFSGLFGSRPAAVPAPGGTAIYDISAHTVYMPDGSKLEAHSGLGALLDDPRFVHQKMRGATPPAVYDLTLREQLFHGVQALRLTPVGGSTLYGRNGLLAHTYMLGANGDSNGCVSFRDYNAFLKAYMSGQVRRLVVVANR